MSFNRPQITLYIKEPQWGSGYYLDNLFPSLGLTCECSVSNLMQQCCIKTLDIVGKVIVVVSVVPIEKSIKSTIRDINKNGENG